MRMRLPWLSNSRPDCLFGISQLSQMTEEFYRTERPALIHRINKAIRYAVDNRVKLSIEKPDLNTLRIIGFSDPSFANNRDLSSQLGHIFFLGDASNRSIPISLKSYEARRINRPAMYVEVISFSDMFYIALELSQGLKPMLEKSVPVHLMTDRRRLFDVVSKGSRTSEKPMMLDIAAAREAFREKIITDIGLVRSQHNVADGLTKPLTEEFLRQMISSGRLRIAPAQWIICQGPSAVPSSLFGDRLSTWRVS